MTVARPKQLLGVREMFQVPANDFSSFLFQIVGFQIPQWLCAGPAGIPVSKMDFGVRLNEEPLRRIFVRHGARKTISPSSRRDQNAGPRTSSPMVWHDEPMDFQLNGAEVRVL